MHETNENNDCATLSLTLRVLHNNNNNFYVHVTVQRNKFLYNKTN